MKRVSWAQIDVLIYRVLGWVLVALCLIAAGGFAWFTGRLFLSRLPIVWNGDDEMWMTLYVGHLVVLVIVGLLWFAVRPAILVLVGLILLAVRSGTARTKDGTKSAEVPRGGSVRSVEERAAHGAYSGARMIMMLTFVLGANALFPDDSVPLPLGIALMVLGGGGFYCVVRLGQLTGLDRGGWVGPPNRSS